MCMYTHRCLCRLVNKHSIQVVHCRFLVVGMRWNRLLVGTLANAFGRPGFQLLSRFATCLQTTRGHPAFFNFQPGHVLQGSTQQHWPFPETGLEQGHVYMLTHPGTPCLFYDHV